MTTITKTADETIEVARKLADTLQPDTVIALTGTLGAGKTTFTKGIALSLNITEEVTSPTFTLIQEYSGRLPMFHMDLYRLDSVEEFEMLGAEDYFYQKGITLIEWSEKAEEILPKNTIHINISVIEDNQRKIEIS